MRFIVVDGLDGAGKDTHARFIAKRYEKKGEKVLIRNHPSDSFFGRRAKKNLLGRGKISHLKASIYYFLDVIYSLLRYYRRVDTLVFVRYIGGVFYLPTPIAKVLYSFFSTVLPTSRYMFFLEAKPEVLLERLLKREEKEMFENIRDLQEVRERALSLLKGWHVINTEKEIEKTRAEIEKILDELDGKAGKTGV